MAKIKVAVTLDSQILRRLDRLVRDARYPSRSRAIEGEIPETLDVPRVDVTTLPPKWHEARSEALRRVGDDWIRTGRTAALLVPSAAIRGEWNVLLNPAHADFSKVRFWKAKAFECDVRMFRWRDRGSEQLAALGSAADTEPRHVDGKRAKTLTERGLDFADVALAFAGVTVEVEDTRKNYGEKRIICYGLLAGGVVVVGYTQRGVDRHVFGMRKAK